MKFLILNADYPQFLHSHYTRHQGLEDKSYAEQMRMRIESLFGGPYHYSVNLEKLGHEAKDIYLNNEYMQKAWAREHGFHVNGDCRWEFRLRRGIVPWISKNKEQRWVYDILAAQIRYYKPDVLLNQAMDTLRNDFLEEIKPHVRLLVGQIAAPLPQSGNWSIYDLVISSLPNLVTYFRSIDVPSELNRLGFEPAVLSKLSRGQSDIDVSFVGSLHPAHQTRIAWLEYLCSQVETKVWANGIDRLPRRVRSARWPTIPIISERRSLRILSPITSDRVRLSKLQSRMLGRIFKEFAKTCFRSVPSVKKRQAFRAPIPNLLLQRSARSAVQRQLTRTFS